MPCTAHTWEAKVTAELWSDGLQPPGLARQQAMLERKSELPHMHLASPLQPAMPLAPMSWPTQSVCGCLLAPAGRVCRPSRPRHCARRRGNSREKEGTYRARGQSIKLRGGEAGERNDCQESRGRLHDGGARARAIGIFWRRDSSDDGLTDANGLNGVKGGGGDDGGDNEIKAVADKGFQGWWLPISRPRHNQSQAVGRGVVTEPSQIGRTKLIFFAAWLHCQPTTGCAPNRTSVMPLCQSHQDCFTLLPKYHRTRPTCTHVATTYQDINLPSLLEPAVEPEGTRNWETSPAGLVSLIGKV